MSPLIDMVFLLLIFFMVTAVFTKDTGININRPTAQSAKPLNPNAIFFTIDAKGDIKHAGQPYTIAQIPNLIAEINPAKQASHYYRRQLCPHRLDHPAHRRMPTGWIGKHRHRRK